VLSSEIGTDERRRRSKAVISIESQKRMVPRRQRGNIIILSLCQVQEHICKCEYVRINYRLSRYICAFRIKITNICGAQVGEGGFDIGK